MMTSRATQELNPFADSGRTRSSQQYQSHVACLVDTAGPHTFDAPSLNICTVISSRLPAGNLLVLHYTNAAVGNRGLWVM